MMKSGSAAGDTLCRPGPSPRCWSVRCVRIRIGPSKPPKLSSSSFKLAKEMREAERRGEELGLNDQEAAFYEALEVNDSTVAVLGDETLKTIARELVNSIRDNVSVDWTVNPLPSFTTRVGNGHRPQPGATPAFPT